MLTLSDFKVTLTTYPALSRSSYHHNMPTGPAHERIVNEVVNGEVVAQQVFPCRCMQGEDHAADDSSWGDEDDSHPESNFAGAEEIWLSSGMDEDYDFRTTKH